MYTVFHFLSSNFFTFLSVDFCDLIETTGFVEGQNDVQLGNTLYTFLPPSQARHTITFLFSFPRFSRRGRGQGTHRHVGVHFHLYTALCRLFGFMWFLLLKDANMPALRLSTPSASVTGTMRGARSGRHDLVGGGRGRRQERKKACHKVVGKRDGGWEG